MRVPRRDNMCSLIGLLLTLLVGCADPRAVGLPGSDDSGDVGTLPAESADRVEEGEAGMTDARAMQVADKHEIEVLQRLYAKATDTIGLATPESVEAGREIYHRIFADNVEIRTANTGADPLVASGPDAWVDVVYGALKDYTGTQHMIGSQLVEVDGDSGVMESYLNAWHKRVDGSVYYFLGTYISTVERTSDGWHIVDMTLRHDSSGVVETQG